MVPPVELADYYGRPVVKPPVWKEDIAYYFFLGGLAAGASLLAAGAERTGRPTLRRRARISSVGALGLGTVFLVRDLGRPERFHHMLRVAKPTSPMSVGTWVLSAFGAAAGIASASEVAPALGRRAIPRGARRRARAVADVEAAGRLGGLAAAALAPAVASYTAVLISDTAVPAWNEPRAVLPFVFTAGAALSAGGLGMIVAPTSEAGPARRLARYGALGELVTSQIMEQRPSIAAEPYRTGDARRILLRARALTATGLLGAATLGRTNRAVAAVSGAALMAGALCERIGVFHAGVASTLEPRYVLTRGPTG